MRRALLEFDAIQEHDKRVAGLGGPEVPLYRLATNALGPGESLSRLVRQEVFAAWIVEAEGTHPELTGDPFSRYLSLRRRLKDLLDQRRTLFVRLLLRELAARARTPLLPPGQHHPNKRPETDWNRLLYEFGKQRRVKPVRRLLEEFPFQFLRIAGCWLASPEAVSEVFPLRRGMFDLVIFDEASQLAVERAIPACYRGKRVVIAGDEKQLQPFDLFQLRDEEDAETADDVVEAESLLLLAMRTFDTRNLSWHYRSRYQELIDFSNHAFYDGYLQIAANVQRTFPTAPIEFVRCDGIWEERTNPREAEKVVDLVTAILREGESTGRTPSVGVITFNDPQRECVLDAIDARRESDAEFDRLYTAADMGTQALDDRPFVKNIENVQGDERDVILFSVGYAPDAAGKLRVQFGSLNVLGGENRLNVAVTRARQRVILVASFDPEQLSVEGTKNPGPKRLKDYLRYAAAVSRLHKEEVHALLENVNPQASLVRPGTTSDGSVLEDQVADALRSEGYGVERNVGFSGYRLDLAVIHPHDPSRYVLGIECDGSAFHSAKSARERDVTRQRFLEERGWAMERVWSRNWWRSRSAEMDRLRRRIQALSGPDSA